MGVLTSTKPNVHMAAAAAAVRQGVLVLVATAVRQGVLVAVAAAVCQGVLVAAAAAAVRQGVPVDPSRK